MSSSARSILLGLVRTLILAVLGYVLSFLSPNLDSFVRAIIAASVAIVGLILWHYGRQVFRRFTWPGRVWAALLDGVKTMLRLIKTGIRRFRACMRGDLEQCQSELETKIEEIQEERDKVDKLTVALATLSQPVMGLCDMKMENPDELEWSGVLVVSERAVRCAKAVLHHHVAKVVYYDPTYPASWMKGQIAEQTRRYFVDRWFVEKNAQQLQNWICEVLDNGRAHKSLIVFAQDIVPETVAGVPNKTCLIRRYLDAGGRVVWRGDVPFWYQGKPNKEEYEWGLQAPQKILEIDYTNQDFAYKDSDKFGGQMWDKDFPIQLTQAGYDIGLSYPRQHIRIRPVSGESVSVSYLRVQPATITLDPAVDWDDDNLTVCWKKNFNERYRHSGFMQYLTGEFLPNDVNDHLFSFAISGWPLFFD